MVRPAHQDENARAESPGFGDCLGQGAAIGRRHGAVIEGKVQIGDGAVQFAADRWIAVPLRQSRDVGGEDDARRRLDGAGRRVPRVPDPDDAVARRDCDGWSRARQRSARRTCKAVSLMCVEDQRLAPEENGRRAGRAVGGANLAQHCGDRVGCEIHAAILSPAGTSEGRERRRVRLGAFAALDHGDRLFDAGESAVDWAILEGRRRWGVTLIEATNALGRRSDMGVARIRLAGRYEIEPLSTRNNPRKRRRAAIAAHAGMHDEAKRPFLRRAIPPDVLARAR